LFFLKFVIGYRVLGLFSASVVH